MRHADEWTGKHRHITFSIRKWRPGGDPAWASYVYLHEQAVPEGLVDALFLPPGEDEKHPENHDYYASPWADLPWSGGCTWYSYTSHYPGKRVVKVGHDYSHSWDRDAGYPYDEEWLRRDIEKVIDAMWERWPDMKIRCGWNGSWNKPADMVPWGDSGSLISKEGAKARAEWDAENKAKKEQA